MKHSFFAFAFVTLLSGHLSALVVDPSDFFTESSRISPITRAVDSISIFNGTAIQADVDDLIIRSVDNQKGKLWRYNPVSGESALLFEGESVSAFYGQNIIAGKFLGDLFLMTGGTDVSSVRVLALSLNALTTRTFEIPGLEITRPDILVTPNGRLAAIAAGGDGVIMTLGTGEIVADPGGLSGHVLKGLTRTPDFRLIGVTSTSDLDIGLVQIDLDTGILSPIAILSGIDVSDSFLRVVSTQNGDFFLSVYGNAGGSRLYFVDGNDFQVQEIPLPDGVDLDSISSLKLDPNGDLLIGVLDKRVSPEGARIFLRMHRQSYSTTIAVGSPGLRALPMGYMTHVQDGVLYAVPPSVNGLQDKVLRMELKTGATTVVTSSDRPGAVITRARQIALNGNDLYVVNEDADQNSYLIHVDATTGAQSQLTFLGNELFIEYMIYEGRTGQLLFTALGGHPDGGYGTVMSVRAKGGADPRVLTDMPFPSQPKGLAVNPTGELFVCGTVIGNQLFQIDRITGEWSVLSNYSSFQNPVDLEVMEDGQLLVLDNMARTLFRVNPENGSAAPYMMNFPADSFLVKIREASDPPPNLFSEVMGAERFDNNWYFLDWYGWFNEVGPWFRHLEHGWQYYGGGTPVSIYLYDGGLGSWVWTRPSVYPFIYAFTPYESWFLYSEGGNPEDRWFFSYREYNWINIQNF